MKDTNRRFKIHTDDCGPSKGATILFQVRRYSVTHHPASLKLVWDLSSRDSVLNSLGSNKSFNVRMFVVSELEYPTDALDELINTLRNDRNTYPSLTPAMISMNINTRINEKFIIEEIEEGVI